MTDFKQVKKKLPEALPPLTKTRIGNHLRRHSMGDIQAFRQGFKEGIEFAQRHQRVQHD